MTSFLLRIRRICPIALPMLLASCVVGPDYRKPSTTEMGVPATWHGTIPHKGDISELTHWWTRFNDPNLSRLIEAAEQDSPSIAIAIARVRAARAAVTINKGELLPALSASGSIFESHTSTKSGGITTASAASTVQSGSADAAWELDLFGGNRRALEGSKARLSSAEAAWHDARITLAASVAETYMTARAYQNLIAIAEQELASRQTTQDLTAIMIREGLAPSVNAYATEASTATSASSLETQRGSYARVLNGLVLLTGLGFEEIESALDHGPATIPQDHLGAAVALPAAVVGQRPDVRAVEGNLAAASADIGAATAAILPSLTLIGSIGINAPRTDGVTVTTNTWSIGPALNVPLFTGGRATARVEATRAAYDEALARYRATTQNAVQEVENALVRIDTVERQRIHVMIAAEKFRAYFDSISESYRQGKSSLLELESARLQSLVSQQLLITTELEHAQASVALYKAIGGGWETEPEPGGQQ